MLFLQEVYYDGRQPNYMNTVLQSIHELGIAKQIYLLGLIPRVEQIQLIRCSIGIIQPSMFEGWITAVEDARCLGKPTILSDIHVHLEQNPPNSVFFENDSAEDLSQKILDLFTGNLQGFDLTNAKSNKLTEIQ